MNVRILATCSLEELLPYTLLVFGSIRVGFPTANIQVTGNALTGLALSKVSDACKAAGCEFSNGSETIHHEWIEKLVNEEKDPFYVLDTDVNFYENFERYTFETALAGFRVPEFHDEFTGAITRARLHTSLLYVDPVKVLEQIKAYESQFPVTPFNPMANLFYPLCLPFNGEGFFYDTCSMLFNAIGGTEFTALQKDSYFHFNFGCLSDLVLPRLRNGKEMQIAREAILKNPELGRGLWREQMQYYEDRRPGFVGRDVIAPIEPEDARDARAWNVELCKGDNEAMLFCDLWYGYVHGIDDLIDTVQDGRPSMSKRQMISLFFRAAMLYNTAFYKAHSTMLFSLVLDITNAYTISVEWEVSPRAHLRIMADTFRTAGNRMYGMIALICGGEEHMLNISQRINERDWLGQHDKLGNPI